MEKKKVGIYVHVPFCMSLCPYCDFYKVLGKIGDGAKAEETRLLKKEYLKALKNEAISRLTLGENQTLIDTLYLGGGTPNFLDANEIEEITSWFRPYFACEVETEISMEYNPKVRKMDEAEYLKKVFKAGVNRLSIGVQSFDDECLKVLGRVHKASDAKESFNLAREAGFKNISLDLMFGIPGIKMESWKETLNAALKLRPEHISAYSLEFMEGTKFTKLRDEGKMLELAMEIDREMYHVAIKTFEDAGLKQYEISNFAKEGFESKHNMKYWCMDEYLGLGPSSHSLYMGTRWENHKALDEYLKDPTYRDVYEKLDKKDEMSEYIFTGLRKIEGVGIGDFAHRFGLDIFEAFPEAKREIESFVKSEDVYIDEESLRLTRKGLDISNMVMCLFV